jgi:hypothetical protein
MFTEFRKSLVDGRSRSVGYVHKRPKAWPTYGNLLCKTVGESPIVFREIQVRSCGSSYAQVCTQFIQGNVPIDPDRLCAWDEKIGIFGGRLELSTWLSPAVDNSINRWRIRGLRFIPATTMRRILGPITL